MIVDCNIRKKSILPTPEELGKKYPASEKVKQCLLNGRQTIRNILSGQDKRLLVIVGPCSIHDVQAGKEYAEKLAELSKRVEDHLFLVMRTYFEKPRTSHGWKGLIMDPHLNGKHDIEQGLSLARNFLSEVLALGVPTATEILDPVTPQYIGDLICWSAIGARTAESQMHRQLASGLSTPVGFKNSTDGNYYNAINAIRAARLSQSFLGITEEGSVCAISTKGNPDCHIILRGGNHGPNYSPEYITAVARALADHDLPINIVVDCSHGNSDKDYRKQPEVFANILDQLHADPYSPIIGAMLESNLNAGNQSFPQPKEDLRYGVSITDACLDWQATEAALLQGYAALSHRFESNKTFIQSNKTRAHS